MEHLATVTLDTMFANFPLELESCSSLDSFEDAQVEPLSGAVKPADRKACSSSCQQLPTEAPRPPAVPTVAWEDDSTEKRTQGRKSKKESIQTQEETQVCAFVPEDPSQELPHTSRVDPTGTDPRESEPTDRSFESLYDVGLKLKSRRGVSYHLGFRNSDDKRVLIKFIKKNRPEKLVELPGYSNPLSKEAAAMLMVQKPPTSEHLVQLYDHFVMEDQDILIMEYPRSYISLFDYVQRNSSNLTETEVKLIIQGLIVALHHCMSRGVYRRTHMKNILVHTKTLHVKLMDFGGALLVEERRDAEPLLISAIRKYAEWATTEDLRILLDLMVPRISRCFWMRPRVSKECLDLLEHLHDVKSRMTLQAMLKHDWFKRKTEA
ncbi:serine/threonine-protein kinase pim-1-like [Megalobrama amblycephala]|uniref:serine/threonine-protein kinase pim-1-like n=1 Tax=Megalobrama amblycephala TaxID=75352 RepID=UPI002013EFED|nr:serine/threonine-protein kinase pim-1-like [Megalobrama amblycephala]XP_048021057.1 serine/threonine-protein kinase pim-1-like [Megalobrama amblycephala]XP_048021058.1 serine/threonine-protein kinase pim-1-like [Megalobrama amblycephala]XP_048021059.1 serine/threonine-protein kinase pim-1-like [Megalobrama amblycephala]